MANFMKRNYVCSAGERDVRVRRARLLLAVAMWFGVTLQAQANPIGAQVVSGTASIGQAGNTLTVTNSPNAIINWQGFSIGQGETTRFVQQNANSAVLNRVIGADPSQLLGTLSSNGRVFLVNPAGILVGQGARIDVAGLVASTLNLSDADFLANNYNFTSTLNAAGVLNAGSITTPEGGTVYLIAPQVENQGLITTPKGETILAAGNAVQLIDTATPGVSVQIAGSGNNAINVGRILADSGRIGMVGAMVRNSGELNASSLVSQGGKVFLKASQDTHVDRDATVTATGSTGGTIEVLGNRVAVTDNARVDASGQSGGGTVLVGGDAHGANPDIQNAKNTFVGSNATIKADAIERGNGGKVIVWADDTARVYGSLSARAGSNGGNGGFIETSGRNYLDVAGIRVSTASPLGSSGSWLLDPYDIVIGATDTPATYTGNPNFVGAGGATSFIGASVIQTALDGGTSVIVDTTGVAAGTGNITVDAAINTANAGAATLTLNAHNDIVINAPLNMNNSLVLNADQDTSGTGSVVFNKDIVAGASIAASGRDIVFASLDGGTTFGRLTATSVALTAANVITPTNWGAAVEINNAQSLSLTAVNGIGSGGKVFVANVPGAITFSNTNNAVNIYNTSASPAGRSFTGTNTNGPVRLESSDSTYATTIGNITSGGNLLFRMNNLTTGGGAVINAGINTVYINPYTISPSVPTISIGGTDIFNLTGADISKITAGKIVIGTDSFGNYAPTVNIATSAAVTIANSANLEIWGAAINTGANAFSNTNGGLALIGDSMAIGGTINVGASGKVSLQTKTSTQNIDAGGVDSAGVLGLSATELGMITAGHLKIGSSGTGNINISAAIAPSVTNLSLYTSAGGITQAAAGAITAPALAVRAGANVVLDTAANSVTDLAAAFTNGANFSFKNAGALNVGTIAAESLNGISGASVISLISGSALTQSAGALLGGTSLYAEGGAVTLNEANPVGVVAGKTTAGDFIYNTVNQLTLSNVGGGNGISVPTANNIRLSSNVGINQNPGSVIKANGASGGGLALVTPGHVFLGEANDVRTVAASLTGAGSNFKFVNSENVVPGTVGDLVVGSLTVGGVTTTGITSNGGDINFGTPGLLTVLNPIAAGAGRIGLFADDLILSNTVTSASEVGIVPYSANIPITIGAACGSPPCLSVTNLWRVNAPTIGIGEDGVLGSGGGTNPVSGAISVAGITTGGTGLSDRHVNTTRIGLFSGAGITQSGAINVQDLGVSAGTSVTLTGANLVGNLAGKAAAGSFQYANAQPLNIVVLSGGSGFSAYSMPGIQAVGDALLTINGGVNLTNTVISSSGIATLSATGGLTISSSTSDALIAGSPDVNLTLGGDIVFTASGIYKARVSSGQPATINLTFSNSTSRVLFNGVQATATTSGNMGFFFGATPAVLGTNLVVTSGDANNFVAAAPPPPTIAECTLNPTLAGCTSVLPPLADCTLNPTLAGCTAVLPPLADCTLNPTLPGCTAVLPPLADCTLNPTLAGCTAVLPPLADCTLNPTLAGCTAVLPPLVDCTLNPTLAGCTAVLPPLADCTLNPTLAGCTAVLPPLADCTLNPTLAGCTAVLPPLADCTLTPTLPGCTAVLPPLADCTLTPTLPGCTAVLPPLADCALNPTLAGCIAVLPPLADCTLNPALAGCAAVLPTVADCIQTPNAQGCAAVLPVVATCLATPTLPGCDAVQVVAAACAATPTLPGCVLVLPAVVTPVQSAIQQQTSNVLNSTTTASNPDSGSTPNALPVVNAMVPTNLPAGGTLPGPEGPVTFGPQGGGTGGGVDQFAGPTSGSGGSGGSGGQTTGTTQNGQEDDDADTGNTSTQQNGGNRNEDSQQPTVATSNNC